ncbi:MAG: PAS domain S-box protein [Proteobacteria bacterium]|nr:PAS domain S-box protein [Pseudomonadota bacterium]MBU1715603.1 PAS domain S-box protein [Pseudomonadota bacterium]
MSAQRSLRYKIIKYFVLVAVVPLLLVGGISYYYITQQVSAAIMARNEQLAQGLGEDLGFFLTESEVILSQIHNVLDTNQYPLGELNLLLDLIVGRSGFLESVSVTDLKGMVLFVGLKKELIEKRQDFVGLDLSGNEFFQKARRTGQSSWSDTFISIFTGKPSITLCQPFNDKMLTANLCIERISEVVRRYESGGIILSVMDRDGVLIYHSEEGLARQRFNLGRVVDLAAGGNAEKGTYRYELEGISYLGSVSSLANGGWRVLVSQPVTVAYAPADRLRIIFALGILVSVLLALGGALWVGRKVVMPITMIQEKIKDAIGGKYDQSLAEVGYDEFQELASTFRNMAKKIGDREELLVEAYAQVQSQVVFHQTMIDSIATPVFYLDSDGYFRGCNAVFAEAAGLERNKLIGRNALKAFPGLIANCVKLDIYHLAEVVGLEISEAEISFADGFVHTVMAYRQPFYDKNGNKGGIVCAYMDITARKHAEAALLQSEERLKLALDAAGLGVWSLDVQTGKGFVDERWAGILEYKVDEIVPDIEIWRKFVHPDDLVKVDQVLAEHLAGRRPFFEVEVRSQAKSGGWKWIQDRGQVVSWDDFGKPLRMAGTRKDITEIKLLGEKLRQSQKMEAIGTLAGGIAHDFNNMLNAILGYTELALLDSESGSRMEDNLNEVMIAGKRAASLVKQILAFSRQSEDGQISTPLQPVLKEALKLMRGTLPATIEIRQDIDPECGTVLADVSRIHQVIINLCTNAYHAMREHGGVLEVLLREVEVADEVIDLQPGKYARLTIRDNGEGIDQEFVDRIFEPYFTTKGLGEGTGLGLATVHGIVKGYGGVISVDSKLGEGTVFEVYLPVQPATRVDEFEAVPQEALPELVGHVMFVDDEKSLVSFGERILEKMGCRVSGFTDSVEALEAFAEDPGRFDLVITDQTMPKLTGIKLAREILVARPELPIFLITGYSDVVDKESAKAVGIKEYIEKPINVNEFAEKVKAALAGQ